MNTKQWRRLLKQLREGFPISRRVKVRRRRIVKICGKSTFDGTMYYIEIDSGLMTESQVDTILHEWAHVRLMDAAFNHDARWGEMYASIYEFRERKLEEERCHTSRKKSVR